MDILEKIRERAANKEAKIFKRKYLGNNPQQLLGPAIRFLTKQEEIRGYYASYVSHLMKDKDNKYPIERAHELARKTIEFTLGSFNKETKERWHKVLPELSTPTTK